jgi:hypothetical protein
MEIPLNAGKGTIVGGVVGSVIEGEAKVDPSGGGRTSPLYATMSICPAGTLDV